LTGSYSQAAGATMLFDLNSGTTASDELLTTGNVTLAGLLSLHVPGGAQIPGGTAFTLIDPAAGSTVTGNFSNALSSLTADNGETFNIAYNGGDGNAVVITAVPEPAALALAGLTATLLIRRRRNA
jgi:MYXO-CTERM domain-containing protein